MTNEEAQQKQAGEQAGAQAQANARPEVLPLIITVRTGLADEKNALIRRLPGSYSDRNVQDVLSYVVGTEAKESERDMLASLKQELGAAGSVIIIGGKKVKLTEGVDHYLTDREKDIGGKKLKYRELEIEVNAVQQGGRTVRQGGLYELL